jgi:hypothetical protein
MWVLCVVCGKEGLEEMGEGERFIKDLESEVKERQKMYVFCV